MVTEQDLADVIAGHFQTSRTHAYELMEKALLERGYAHGKTDTQTAVAAERERCATAFEAEVETWENMRQAGFLGSIKRKGAKAIRGKPGTSDPAVT